jgi:hypothetical protein
MAGDGAGDAHTTAALILRVTVAVAALDEVMSKRSAVQLPKRPNGFRTSFERAADGIE